MLTSGLPELVSQLPQGKGLVGLDLEADSLYRYHERICLVQICYADEAELIDPFEQEMDSLVTWLKPSNIWMHGADYDMSLMTREWGMVPERILDTQIAARLLGYESFGYASLVEQVFEIELSKSSQKADWGKRPLPQKMLDYARNDVKYLLPLAGVFEKRLHELGRYSWFLESCDASQKRVLDRQNEPKELWRIAGSGKLSGRELVILKALWEWRDGEASEWNRPAYMVAGNKQLIAWTGALVAGERIDFPSKMPSARRQRLLDMIKVAQDLPESEWPTKPRRERFRWKKEQEEALTKIMEKRNAQAEKLQLDPSIIASRAVLEQLASERVTAEELLLPWQRALLEI